MNRNFYTLLLLFSVSITSFAQVISSKTNTLKQSFIESLELTTNDLKNLETTDDYIDKRTGINHIYVRQQFNQLPIFNAVANAAMRNETVVSVSRGLIKNVHDYSLIDGFTISAEESFRILLNTLGQNEIALEDLSFVKKDEEYTLNNEAVSEVPVVVKKGYFLHEATLKAVYCIEYFSINPENMWMVFLNAQDGTIIQQSDLIVRCTFDSHENCDHESLNPITPSIQQTERTQADATYQVFAEPVESPIHGDRTLVEDPHDIDASPYGWHDVNALAGAEYTYTRGNNVWAQDDLNANNGTGYSVEGGSNLNFQADFKISESAANFLDASIINLFYWNNLMHDVWYHYGFDEAAGNYQQNNYGNGGVGGDYVLADAQDGSGFNNANFNPMTDGNNGRMQMFLWGNGSVIADYFQVDEPSSIAKKYTVALSQISPDLPKAALKRELVLVSDGSTTSSRGCNTLINGANVNGKIALVDRGDCSFAQKILNAQNAGAVGVIIINNVSGAPTAPRGSSAGINIPNVMIGLTDGESIKTRLETETVIGSLYDSSRVEGNFRDSDFDNGVIAHEYGHGISTRLTGGPSNSSCLRSNVYFEQMGEGWSDYLGLVMTQRPTDTPEKRRGIGTYVSAQSTNGGGIRPYPYSTSFSVNPSTYDYIKNNQFTVPHGVGSVWCTMLWDLHWAFIDQYGYDEDLYRGTGGNNMMMQIVLEAMKLQPCGPGFVDGRDAILKADELLYGGENEKLIWTAFAKRGLGFSATQGSSTSRSDGNEAFDLPPYLGNYTITKSTVESAENADVIKYVFKIVNNGGNPIESLEVYDSLGDEGTYVESSDDCGIQLSASSNTFRITFNDIAPGDSVECGYSVRIKNSAGGKKLWVDDVESGLVPSTPVIDQGSIRWLKSKTETNSGLYSWFIQNLGNETDGSLQYELDLSELANPNLTFYHYYITDGGFDGAVVEAMVNGEWVDLGAYMTSNGYNGLINASNGSKIAGRSAFTGDSEGFIQTNIDLSFFQGNILTIRFRIVTDAFTSARGWYLDDIELWNRYTLLTNSIQGNDGEGFNDPTVTSTVVINDEFKDTTVTPQIDVNEVIVVYPNPVIKDAIVKFTSKIERSMDLKLYDAMGKAVWEGSVSSTEETLIPMGQMASGMYVLKMIDGESLKIQKLIKSE